MVKYFIIAFWVLSPAFCVCQPSGKKLISIRQLHQENDTLIWQKSTSFCDLFNKADISDLNNFLPNDFLMQWMHENFIGKNSLLNVISDSAVHRTMMFKMAHNNGAMLKYSDDQSAASLSTTFEFLDLAQMRSIEKQHGYGLCIFYFKKESGKWLMKTVHLDLHCSLCNL